MWAFRMITPVSGLASRAVTGDTNLVMMRGTDHLSSSLAERWRDFELSGCNRTKTESPTRNSPGLLPALYLAATLARTFLKLARAASQYSPIFLGSRWSSSSRNSHLRPRGWFISLPKNREAGVALVDSCHAVLKAMDKEGRFSSQRVC